MGVNVKPAIQQAISDLTEGKFSAVADGLNGALKEIEADEGAVSAETAALPKEAVDIVLDFMVLVAGKFGNHPDMESLINEFKKVL
jgi:hypothetical protein